MPEKVNKGISQEKKIQELVDFLYYNEAVAYDSRSNEHSRDCPCFSSDEPAHKEAFEDLAQELLSVVDGWSKK